MYTESFYITQPVGNNVFSYQERTNKQLFVPSLKSISDFSEIELTDEITFEDYNFDGKLQGYSGLRNFYEWDWQGKKLYLFDNHNHAYYFWYLSRQQGLIQDNSLLYHIDEHADTRDPGEYLMKPESHDLENVFAYTNYYLNVGNYIVPAEKEGLIWETVQIRSEAAIMEYQKWCFDLLEQGKSIILNLDLDFFSPWLDYIDSDLKKEVILDIAQKADIITVCTSPFFIEQSKAVEVFQDIFWK